MTNREIKTRVTFLVGPGFSSMSPQSNRNIVSHVIEVPAIVQSNGVKRGKEANNKRHQKSAKKGALSEYCQIRNRNTKY